MFHVHLSVSFSVCFFLSVLDSFLSFISFFNCTHRSCRLWCMHSWSWQSRLGNVWFTDPLLTFWFDLPFTFQRPGILTVKGLLRSDSACLTMVENHSKYPASWVTDWICHIVHSAQSKIMVSNHMYNSPTPAHTILYEEFSIISFAEMLFHTLVLYILVVKLQANCKNIQFIWSYASLKVTP